MKTLLLDIGNVIMHFDFAPARRRLAESSAAEGDPLDLLRELKAKLEIGEIDGPMFVGAAIAKLEYRESAEQFKRTWEDIFSPNLPMWETIGRARERYRLHLLSNTSDLHLDSLFRNFEVFHCFAGGAYSYRSRCAKPDAAFYRAAIAELDLRPAETLYVDDRAENVHAGSRAGLVSVPYDARRHDRFLRDARAHGFDL